MTHRFILQVSLPDGATHSETGQPITPHQIEAIAANGAQRFLWGVLAQLAIREIQLVTEPATERSAE